VAAAAGKTVDRPWDGEEPAVLLHGVMSRRKRTAPRRRLDHNNTKAQSTYNSMSLVKEICATLGWQNCV
jgi:hypothetical protein